uniref:Putative secreted peptide n=1 Tax=Anopheles braziliensis TaxID=58242 RepID=A0A2M3ZPE9_9DIPT
MITITVINIIMIIVTIMHTVHIVSVINIVCISISVALVCHRAMIDAATTTATAAAATDTTTSGERSIGNVVVVCFDHPIMVASAATATSVPVALWMMI